MSVKEKEWDSVADPNKIFLARSALSEAVRNYVMATEATLRFTPMSATEITQFMEDSFDFFDHMMRNMTDMEFKEHVKMYLKNREEVWL